MHDLLVLLYCCASNTRCTTEIWIDTVTEMCNILVSDLLPPYLLYEEDPFLYVALLHTSIEPSTMDMDKIVKFVSNSGRDVWGPAAWRLLHSSAKNLPEYTTALLECYTKILPCEQCCRNLEHHLTNTPVPDDMHAFTVDIHNQVNVSLGKPVFLS